MSRSRDRAGSGGTIYEEAEQRLIARECVASRLGCHVGLLADPRSRTGAERRLHGETELRRLRLAQRITFERFRAMFDDEHVSAVAALVETCPFKLPHHRPRRRTESESIGERRGDRRHTTRAVERDQSLSDLRLQARRGEQRDTRGEYAAVHRQAKTTGCRHGTGVLGDASARADTVQCLTVRHRRAYRMWLRAASTHTSSDVESAGGGR